MNYYKTLSVTKTIGEWEHIEGKINLDNKTDLNSFLRSRIKKIKDDFELCPSCVTPARGIRVEKRPHITIDQYEDLKPIAKKLRLPVSKIVDIFIIQPLLQSLSSE